MRVAIQETMYLFRRAIGHANQVVISAHGGYPRNNPTNFTVPVGVTLHFYSQHGSTATDFGLQSFSTAAGRIQQSLTGGAACVNYRVSKYQRRHAGSGLWSFDGFQRAGRSRESYTSIMEAIGYVDESNANFHASVAQFGAVEVARTGGRLQDHFDVVTIRNRWFPGDDAYSSGMLDLETVINRVRAVHAYNTIHCFFCRSPY